MKKLLLTCACAAMGAMVMNAQKSSTPITVTSGWNADAICEDISKEPTGSTACETHPWLDTHHSCFLVVDGLDVEDGMGLPEDLKVTSRNGYNYQLGPAAGNNCFYMAKGGDNPSTSTLVFSTPASGTHIGMLCVGANEDTNLKYPCFTVTLNYTDGTSDDCGEFILPGWCNEATTDYAVRYTHRFRATAGSNPERTAVAMTERLAPIASGKQVKSMTVTSTSVEGEWGWAMPTIMAVTAINDLTGITDIEAAEAEVEAIYTIDGVRRADYVNGLNIVKYTDGSVRKVYINK